MSMTGRATTPPISPNPFQTFVTLKHARRTAKGAAIVAGVQAAFCAIAFAGYLAAPPPGASVTAATLSVGVYGVALALLSWRIWVRPGPIKVGLVLLNALQALVFSFMPFNIWSLIFGVVFVNASVLALRGALAMRRFTGGADVEVFS